MTINKELQQRSDAARLYISRRRREEVWPVSLTRCGAILLRWNTNGLQKLDEKARKIMTINKELQQRSDATRLYISRRRREEVWPVSLTRCGAILLRWNTNGLQKLDEKARQIMTINKELQQRSDAARLYISRRRREEVWPVSLTRCGAILLRWNTNGLQKLDEKARQIMTINKELQQRSDAARLYISRRRREEVWPVSLT